LASSKNCFVRLMLFAKICEENYWGQHKADFLFWQQWRLMLLDSSGFLHYIVQLVGVHSALWEQLRSYLEEKSSSSSLEIREYGRRDLSRWPRDTIYPRKLALTSPTSSGRSVGIVHSGSGHSFFYCLVGGHQRFRWMK
jgi:hypothetical protein